MRTPLGSAEDMAGANLSGTTARREIRDKMKAVRDRVDKGAPRWPLNRGRTLRSSGPRSVPKKRVERNRVGE